ncbi:MAG TPA: glycosyltransferase, partial [Candidatus Limnocylindrales bacterium]|nr:glycosyltransferase [Candidatus Limnocylindrales bacterium]
MARARPMTRAVVVIAYCRPASLARVLDSLRAADYPAGEAVPLVISVDGGPRRDDAVVRIAEAAQWPAG